MKLIFLTALLPVLSGCGDASLKKDGSARNGGVVLYIQPFSDLPKAELEAVACYLRTIFSAVQVMKPIALPAAAFYEPRNRYRAEKLLQFLNERTPKCSLTIGLTSRDISTNKGTIPDFGIMGLGLCPGKVCVASGFRMKGKNRLEKFYKVAIHELGHTQGLSHCPVKNCLMRDAEGKDYLDEKTGFCSSCKAVLLQSGWRLK